MGNVCNNTPEDYNDAGTELMFNGSKKITPFQINKMENYGRDNLINSSKESENDEFYFSPRNTNRKYFENDPYDDFN